MPRWEFLLVISKPEKETILNFESYKIGHFLLFSSSYLFMINSQMPLKVNFFCGDCRIAIVINAMYEYGGLTRAGLVPDAVPFESSSRIDGDWSSELVRPSKSSISSYCWCVWWKWTGDVGDGDKFGGWGCILEYDAQISSISNYNWTTRSTENIIAQSITKLIVTHSIHFVDFWFTILSSFDTIFHLINKLT